MNKQSTGDQSLEENANETNETVPHVGESQGNQAGTPPTPLETTISPEFPPLTVEDVKTLRAANRTDDDIKRIAGGSFGKGKKKEKEKKRDLKALLLEKRDWLLEQSGGRPLFSGHVAGTLLVAAGFYPYFRRANSFGDFLGDRGHHLPRVTIGNVKRYDVSFIGKSAGEKEARQAYLDRAYCTSTEVLRELVVTLEDDAEPATAGA
jgi:hypothetical protein